MIKEYLNYKFKATNLHGIHSPFVYQLYKDVINVEKDNRIDDIEEQREKLIKNENLIEVNDLGAGSKKLKSSKRKINDIARNALLKPKYSFLLYRLIKHFQPKQVIELGTSLGITTCYLAIAHKDAHIDTFEGCANTLNLAKKNYSKLNLRNIKTHHGDFDEKLPEHLSSNTVDFAIIDGNHQKQPTLRYFNWLMDKSSENTIFVFDDIYWSEGMKEAWGEIKNDQRVAVTIDLFKMGIVFLNTKQAKEDFILRF